MKAGKDKKTVDDFQLLSQQTKRRIAGLIEMRLTPQTIALFAQEYEDHDPAIRLEIVEFIGFLMDEELARFMSQVRVTPDADENAIRQRQYEFEEKAKNIRKIQDILVQPKQAKPKKTSDVAAKTDTTASKTPLKQTTKAQDDKLAKMLKDAEEREKRDAKIREEQKRRDAEAAKKQAAVAKKATASKKTTTQSKSPAIKSEIKPQAAAAPKKVASPAVETTPAPKVKEEPKVDHAEYIRRQQEIMQEKERQAREYAHREAEKEKLWQELYGCLRTESRQKANTGNNAPKVQPENRDKTPHMKDEKITTYSLMGVKYPIDELTDPKNHMYLFWFKMKQKLHVGNLFGLLETLPFSKQKKLAKKREKWFRKKRGTTSAPKASTPATTNGANTNTNNNNQNNDETVASTTKPATETQTKN